MRFRNFTVFGHKLNRERFYIDPLGTLDSFLCKQKPQKWTFQKVYMNLEKKFIEIGQKFLKIYPKYESGEKNMFFPHFVTALGKAPLNQTLRAL